jgi:toxin ParE1/3/4
MAVTIEWSALAECQLKEIFDYYSFRANQKTAQRIVIKIIKRVDILYKNRYSGPKEELLLNDTKDFRYLVEGNYKIIYWTEQESITIATVFDCRQNPGKMVV